MSGYQDMATGDLIAERAAAWNAGDTDRAQEIDDELSLRLCAILRGQFAHKLRPAGPQARVLARLRRRGGQGHVQ